MQNHIALQLLSGFLITPDEDGKTIDGLFKSIAVLCEVSEKPNSEYEITLMWAQDSIEHGCKALFEAEFPSFDTVHANNERIKH